MKLEWIKAKNSQNETFMETLKFLDREYGQVLYPSSHFTLAKDRTHFQAYPSKLSLDMNPTYHKTLEEAKGALLIRIFRLCSEIMLEIRQHEEFRNFQGKFSQ